MFRDKLNLRSALSLQSLRIIYSIILIYFVADNYIFQYLFIAAYREDFIKSIVFCLSFSKMLILLTSILFIFYYIGKQMKELCGFKYITTGIVGFFAISFLLNIILCLLNLSSPRLEIIGLFALTLFLVLIGILKGKGYVDKLIYPLILIISFVVVYKISETMLINRFPFDIKPFVDEIHNWYTMSVRYFEKGLLFSVEQHTMPGYGLFVHHVWVTVKRLLFLNMNASIYLPPKLLLFLGLGFIIELKLSKKIVIFTILFYLFSLIADQWLRFLLVMGLYGEGVTALFFVIILKEILNNYNFSNPKLTSSGILSVVTFWMIAGVLYITKPFVSYLCFLLPLFYSKLSFRDQKLKWATGALMRIIPMLIFPAVWITISNIGAAPSSHYTLSYMLNMFYKIDLSVMFTIFEHWISHKMTFLFYAFSMIGGIIGVTSYNKNELYASLFFICLNLLMILGLYSTIWVDVEKLSAFRYFSETYYLCLYSFIIGLPIIFGDVNRYVNGAYTKVRPRLLNLGFALKIEEIVLFLKQKIYVNKNAVIGFFVFIAISWVFYYYQRSIDYVGFSFHEKWPDGIYYRWTGKEASVGLSKDGLIELTFVCSHPDVELKPVILTITLNEREKDIIVFQKKGSITKRYNILKSSNVSSKMYFKVSRTWNPKLTGTSNDSRNLGVAISSVKYLDKMPREDIGFYSWENLNEYSIPKWPHGIPQKFRWSGKQASIELKKKFYENLKIFLLCAHPNIDKDPVLVTIFCGDRIVWKKEFKINRWNEATIAISDLKNCGSLSFKVSRTWNPRDLGYSEDNRDLGVAVAIPNL